MSNAGRVPKEIWHSIYALVMAMVVATVYVALEVFWHKANLPLRAVETVLLEIGVIGLLMLLMLRKKRWARSTYSVLMGLSVLSVPLLLGRESHVSPFALVALLLQVFLRLLSVHFLYTKESRAWFNSPSTTVGFGSGAGMAEEGPSNPDPDGAVCESINGSGTIGEVASLGATAEANLGASLYQKFKRMNKLPLVLGGLVLGTILGGLLVYKAHRTAQTEAIRRALSADAALARQLFGARRMVDADASSIRAYTVGLREMDMSDCPRRFQLAYLEHIQAWEALAQSHASADFLGPLVEILVFTRLPDLEGSIPDDQAMREEITRTWNKVEQTALVYGVKVPRQ